MSTLTPQTKSKTKTRINKEQQTQLVHTVIKLLSLKKYSSDIKRVIAQNYNLSPRSAERYISRARREMTKQLDVPIGQLRAESFYFYISIMDNPESTQRERLRARERLDKLMGLDKPVKTQSEIMQYDLTPEEVRSMSDEDLEAAYQKIFEKPSPMTSQPDITQ